MNHIAKTDADTLYKMITKATVVTIVGHTHPDGDALGSTVAMRSFLRGCGKDAEIIMPDETAANLHFISGNEKPAVFTDNPDVSKKRITDSDLLICLDFNSFRRTGEMEPALRDSKAEKILIDHHIAPDSSSFDLVFSRCEISSASELLFWILMEMPGINHDAEKLTAEAAEALMTGMTTDTNNFANSVYPSTLEMASMLLEAGVDRDLLLSKIYNRYKENRLRAMGWLLKDEMTVSEEGLAYMIITPEISRRYNLEEGDTEGFVNLPLAMEQVRMSILLKADKDHYRVSIRSKRGVSANLCSQKYFNGGGHEMAAGGKLFCPKDTASLNRADLADYVERVSKEFLR